MRNNSFDDGLTYFFSQRIHGGDLLDNRPEWAEPESEWESSESAIEDEDILRWADDGGQVSDLGPSQTRTQGGNGQTNDV